MSQTKKGKFRKDYLSGFLIAIIIIIFGTILELVSGGRGTSLPSWPLNAFVGISFAFILAFVHFFYSDFYAVRWLSRVPASISSISLFTLLTLVLGLTIQNNPEAPEIFRRTGLDHIRHSYTFLFSGLYLLTTLGLVILRRTKKLSVRNIGFLLNHLGLWIIVMAGSLGVGDLIRLNIYVNENESVWYGYNNNRQAMELPFTIKLLDFDIDEFNPKIAYIDTKKMSLPEGVENNMVMIEEDLVTEIAGWNIKIDEFLNSAILDSLGNFVSSEDTLAYPIAKVIATHGKTGKELVDYISCGNRMIPSKMLTLNERFSLAMTMPEPREYSSLIEILGSNGQVDTTRLIVNEPIRIDGWELYQLSYDENAGKWSTLSVIEAIKDPWLPIIYVGIFMVIAGALYLFSIGKTPKEE